MPAWRDLSAGTTCGFYLSHGETSASGGRPPSSSRDGRRAGHRARGVAPFLDFSMPENPDHDFAEDGPPVTSSARTIPPVPRSGLFSCARNSCGDALIHPPLGKRHEWGLVDMSAAAVSRQARPSPNSKAAAVHSPEQQAPKRTSCGQTRNSLRATADRRRPEGQQARSWQPTTGTAESRALLILTSNIESAHVDRRVFLCLPAGLRRPDAQVAPEPTDYARFPHSSANRTTAAFCGRSCHDACGEMSGWTSVARKNSLAVLPSYVTNTAALEPHSWRPGASRFIPGSTGPDPPRRAKEVSVARLPIVSRCTCGGCRRGPAEVISAGPV